MQNKELPLQRWKALNYRPNGWALREVHGRPEKFIAITTCRQTGKSVTAKMEFDYGMTRPAHPVYGPPRVAIVGPEYSKAEAVAFAWYEMVTRAFGQGYAIMDKQRHIVTIPSTGAVGYWLTSSNIAGLVGLTLSYLVIDESQLVPDAAWQVLYPTTSVRQAPIRCFGTPDITPDQSWYRGMWMSGRPQENNDDFHSYTVTCYENPWIDPIEIARAKLTLSDAMFRMLYLGEWVSGNNNVFNNIENAFFPGGVWRYVPGNEYILAIDPAITEDYWVCMLGETATGRAVAVDRWHQMPLTEAYNRVQRFWERYGRPRIYIDYTSIGMPVAEELRKRGMTVYAMQWSLQNKMEIIHRLAGAIEHGRIRFPNDWTDLIEELKGFIYTTTPSGKVSAEAAKNYHDDLVMSLAVLNEAFRHRPALDMGDSGQYTASARPNNDPRRPKSLFSEVS